MSRARRWAAVWAPVVAALAGLYLALYLAVALHLFLLASEGQVPPAWRDPEVPASVEVVDSREECASGGCWRQIDLHPAEGGTPADLAVTLGLAEPDRQGWRWYDPHAVEVSAEQRDDLLRVVVRYDTAL